jgi:hypothetical protein
VLFTFGEGSLFDTRLADLLLEVLPTVAAATGFVDRPWFVFEARRQDARYSDFIELARLVDRLKGSDREMVRHWRQRRLSSRPPFDAGGLSEALLRWYSERSVVHATKR